MKRRQFIQRALCATAGSALFGALSGKLSIAHAAAISEDRLLGTDYRALVCVYLYGGNDSFNMLVPRSGAPRTAYQNARGGLALPVAQTHALNPVVAPGDGGSYGFHNAMPQLAALFNRTATPSPLAIVANIGPLLYPITKAQYEAGSVPVPAQLFSHSDQSVTWHKPAADLAVRRGWGGRLADMFFATNPNQDLSMNISVDGENVFQAGDNVVPYFVGQNGAESIPFVGEESWNADRRAAFIALRDAPHGHALQRQYAAVMRRSMANGTLINSALDGAGALATVFPDTPLGQQLRMVARLMQVRGVLQMRRQIFFVGIGGFDTHDRQLEDHAAQLGELDGALAAFHAATVELGIDDAVTTFTASEFGRTTSINGDGTDHGWGGHHLVLGGAVAGRRIYGTLPNLTIEGPDDAGWGQIIPTTAVDQYAATLSRWYGVPDAQMSTVFPNLGRFASANLGFMNT
ncbi:MAG TPA: DUF1501 domain-containing protein [Dokdonella sp.]|uniref:DUF1501 domain-containing protein n=1 Tax=Dokdonella sp. TaxID=2291710 RepID=UPI0025C33D20|nr:DUF1501 domain-containing protein [Dokdonella sp.]MBX3691506.1 DUF1501 domain-containing protein [Dokdonella sp.]HNR91058.1 DUF1501 domain-containing protein [Dokdonella sp.]